MKKKAYSWKGFLINFIWRVILPVFVIWFVDFLFVQKIIDEKKDKWAGPIFDPLIVTLIIGTCINLLVMLYYLIMILYQRIKKEKDAENSED